MLSDVPKKVWNWIYLFSFLTVYVSTKLSWLWGFLVSVVEYSEIGGFKKVGLPISLCK